MSRRKGKKVLSENVKTRVFISIIFGTIYVIVLFFIYYWLRRLDYPYSILGFPLAFEDVEFLFITFSGIIFPTLLVIFVAIFKD